MAFQFRRGTDAERQSITPRPGEPLYVTDTGQVYVGDGTTQGGNPVSLSVSGDESPSLGGNLDLNGNNIVGTGNIDIDGYITATGNINLGDGVEDNVIVGGVISSSLIPSQDGKYDLGDSASRWRNGFFEGVDIAGEISVDTISAARIIDQDSSVLYDSNTGTFTGTFTGDGNRLDLSSLDSSIVPNFDNFYDLGSDSLRWRSIHIDNAFVSSEITADSQITTNDLNVTNIYPSDSSTVSFSANVEFNGSIVPEIGGFHSIGTDSNAWSDAYINQIQSDFIFSGTRIESNNSIVSPIFLGDIEGSVIGNDSSLLVDSGTNAITTENYRIENNRFNFTSISTGELEIFVNSEEDRSVLRLERTSTSSLTPEDDTIYGSVLFSRNDIDGTVVTSAIAGTDKSIILFPDRTGEYTDSKKIFKFTDEGFFGVGTDNPSATLDVRGEIVSNSYVQFGSFTITERDALIAANGMVIYNTTDNKFQGYQDGSWINLDDGTAA